MLCFASFGAKTLEHLLRCSASGHFYQKHQIVHGKLAKRLAKRRSFSCDLLESLQKGGAVGVCSSAGKWFIGLVTDIKGAHKNIIEVAYMDDMGMPCWMALRDTSPNLAAINKNGFLERPDAVTTSQSVSSHSPSLHEMGVVVRRCPLLHGDYVPAPRFFLPKWVVGQLFSEEDDPDRTKESWQAPNFIKDILPRERALVVEVQNLKLQGYVNSAEDGTLINATQNTFVRDVKNLFVRNLPFLGTLKHCEVQQIDRCLRVHEIYGDHGSEENELPAHRQVQSPYMCLNLCNGVHVSLHSRGGGLQCS